MQGYEGNPEEFVQKNHEVLVRILKHSDDAFVRSLIISSLIEYGREPQIEDIERELKRAMDQNGGGDR
jgi:hypothetical protein